jgi:DNA integrity scanning protein DisA with diadenylate cyclase activity
MALETLHAGAASFSKPNGNGVLGEEADKFFQILAKSLHVSLHVSLQILAESLQESLQAYVIEITGIFQISLHILARKGGVHSFKEREKSKSKERERTKEKENGKRTFSLFFKTKKISHRK